MSSEQITRNIMGNVPPWLGTSFYVAAFLAISWTAFALYRRMALHRAGRKMYGDDRQHATKWSHKVAAALSYLALHRQLLRDRYAGVAHLLTFYGFVILFIGTCLVFLEYDTPLHFFYGWFYRVASLVIDLGGVAMFVGLGMFLWRRHFAQVRATQSGAGRLLRAWWVSALAWLLMAITVTGFLLEGARIARDFPAFERWSAVGYTIACGLGILKLDGAIAAAIHQWCWGAHAFLCVGFFALLPWKFFGHVIFGLLSWISRRERPIAQLVPHLLDTIQAPGAQVARDLSPMDLLQADGCTTCGRCNSVCPALEAGKPLWPREIVLSLRAGLDLGLDERLSRWISDDALWSCTTCGACNAACPVGIDVYHKIVELRRGRVEDGIVPSVAEQLFDSVADKFNPFQRSNQERMLWAHDLRVPLAQDAEHVELLYWVGCAGSFDPDGQSVARSMIKILNYLGIDYRVLGTAERCTGDPARRLGEEGLYQSLASANRALLARHKVKRVLTHCPHCFNTMRNEYQTTPAKGDHVETDFEIIHHTQFLRDLLVSGRLRAEASVTNRVTFHDPCYLGRGNGVVDAPRQALASISGIDVKEMPRNGINSFCCGAGGGSMWLDIRGQERIENIRYQEAASTGAQTIVTGCPFCKTMLEAARQMDSSVDAAKQVRVRDLAEMIVDALKL